MSFSSFTQLGALSRRIYLAFLWAAVIPTAVAGVIGVFVSLETLKRETLSSLEREVTVRAQGIGRFFDQLGAELLYLAHSRNLMDLIATASHPNDWATALAMTRLQRDYSLLASVYPHVYQIRLLTASGQEWVRVDRLADGEVVVVPEARLQNKHDRYYFQDAMQMKPGQIYISPLDLNVEFGVIEKPERPVVRLATPVGDRVSGIQGLLIINLHADILLTQIQEMADGRHGSAYLLDSAGHYVGRSAKTNISRFQAEPASALERIISATISGDLGEYIASPRIEAGWIVAHAPIAFSEPAFGEKSSGRWFIALAFPEHELFLTAVNLYGLYLILLVALFVTALSGFALSRRLLEPLEELAEETDAIARGHFDRRVSVKGGKDGQGGDEIAMLGRKFNTMAEHLETSARQINAHRNRLEDEVRARTRELEQERAAIERVIENTADGIVALDQKGRIRLLNAAAHRLLGTSSADIGTSIVERWPRWPQLTAVPSDAAYRCELASGDQLLSLAITPVTQGFIVVFRDVSAEREIQDSRRELDRQMFQMEKLTTLGELAMGVAHEIGNPLAGMKAVVQAVQYEEDLTPAIREPIRRLEREIDRLSDFLRSFHGFSAQRPIQLESCPLAEILDDVLFWTRKDAKSQSIQFRIDGVEQLPPLCADPSQLKQVLLNLLVNAVHAMPAGGWIAITACKRGRDAEIRMQDTGFGMSEEVRRHAFDPFFTTRREGSGLGLTIVRKIVEQHGGRITVESESGHGSCFVITWPLMGDEHG